MSHVEEIGSLEIELEDRQEPIVVLLGEVSGGDLLEINQEEWIGILDWFKRVRPFGRDAKGGE